MNLVFVTEARFDKNKSGEYFNNLFNNQLWERYLTVFESIYIVARVNNNILLSNNSTKIDCINRIYFEEIPYYIGPLEYLKNRKFIKLRIQEIVLKHKDDTFLCRVPGNVSNLVIQELRKIKKNYSLEIVGDPWESINSLKSINPIFRQYLRIISTYKLKNHVKNASALLYVTKHNLQKRYKSINCKFITYASNVILNDNSIAKHPKRLIKKTQYNLISIGSLSQMYKAPDVLIKSISLLKSRGVICNLTWVGGGKYLEKMKNLATKYNVHDFINFVGEIPNKQVLDLLNNADLFVTATRTEGLPRSIIEAMSCGLPCVGTNVGGIPELISNNVLVKKNSVKELALIIEKILNDEKLYNCEAIRNLKYSHDYKDSILSNKRTEFYNFIGNNL